MKLLKSILFTAAILCGSTYAVEKTAQVFVNTVGVYTNAQHANLDIKVTLSTACPSGGMFYIEREGDVATSTSILLTALAKEKTVIVHFDRSQKPNFSAGDGHCKIYSVDVVR